MTLLCFVPGRLSKGDIVAMDRAYINYEKFEELTQRGVIYVTKMKKSLRYEVLEDVMYQTLKDIWKFEYNTWSLLNCLKMGNPSHTRHGVITYADVQKRRIITLLTNDMELDPAEIIAIYRQRWEIELLFKQLKQNFPLKYFYGESANAIKIQIWVTLIANLLLMVMKSGLT